MRFWKKSKRLMESVGKPVPRQSLARVLLKQEVGPPQRIQQAITANLRGGILVLHSGDRVGLAAWQEVQDLEGPEAS